MSSRNRVTSRVVHYLYAILNLTGGEENEIKRDPLHRRYEVNRHGLTINHRDDDPSRLKELRRHLITKLMEDGWMVKSDGERAELEAIRDGKPVSITIDPVIDRGMGGQPRYDISPYTR